jgi:hypothetical protein
MPMMHADQPRADVIVIGRRYRGPPDSANGGYACGLLATRMTGQASVRLHRPPPLEQPLVVRSADAGQLRLFKDSQLIAEANTGPMHNDVPPPVSFESATGASAHYRWKTGHPFPGCFVCGPERHHGDALCIFPGPLAERSIVAAPWVPDPTVCDATGHVQPEVLWAALDCPSWFGLLEFEPGTTVALLGQLSARLLQRPAQKEPCVVIGWSRGREGRKLYAGAALFTSSGTLLGHSTAVWIEPKH